MPVASNKAHKIPAENFIEYKDVLSGMCGKRFSCIAMINLTNETIYHVALKVVERAIRKTKAFLSAASSLYRIKTRVIRKFEAYLCAKKEYDIMMKLMEIKMFPSRSFTIVEQLLEDIKMAENGNTTQTDEEGIEV